MKNKLFPIFFALYLIAYVILASFSLAVFTIFRPFKYVDNVGSYLLCLNESKYYSGPNLVFSFDGKLDSYNDKKARKVCQYGIIRDYKDEFKASDQINYDYHPVYMQESSISDAVLALLLTLLTGSIIIEAVMKLISYFIYKKDVFAFLFGRRILNKFKYLLE